ncbi:MAG TPA: YraN family protein [Phaeodactylibacter sp.]|nr:YraN family protein [Phaeodactylibacter sp.]
MPTKNQRTGKRGEDAALAWLQKRGYRLLERNWRHHRYEIDLIFEKEGQLIFVEVKTRTHDSRVERDELPAIQPAQQERIFDAAVAYAEALEHEGEIRFDLFAVLLAVDGCVLEVEHLPNAFYPGMPFF